MGLPKAIKAHAANDLLEAEKQYERAYNQNVQSSVLFQNYGSLLAKIGKKDKQKKSIKRSSLHPNNHTILRNYANLLRRSKPSSLLIIIYFA